MSHLHPIHSLAFRRRALALLLLALLPVSCTDGPASVSAPAQVTLNFLTPATVRSVVVEVTGPGITPAAVLNIPVGTDSTARATLALSAGAGRRIVFSAFDSAGIATHRADTTVTLVAGTNTPLAVRLTPLSSSLGVTATFGGTRVTVTDTSSRNIVAGDTLRIPANATRPNGTAIPVDSLEWGSSNPAIATVTAGLVRALRPGETWVTVSRAGAAARVRVVVTTNVIAYRNADAGLIQDEPDTLRVANPSPSLLEEFAYNITVPFDYSSSVLATGKVYRIRISGRGGVGPLDGSNYQNSKSDAAFFFCGYFVNLDTCQVPASGTNWVSAWSGIAARRPFPDVYTTSHVYDYYVRGKGAALTWTFRDNPYSDNNGDMRVQIFLLGNLVP